MMKYILPLFLFVLALAACKEDEPETRLNPAAIQAGEEFLDPRDNNTYRTVRVGNQLWMAENLRYALPGYSLDGAYTWGEDKIEKTSIRPSDSQILELALSIARDPKYNGWPFQSGKLELQLLPMVEGYAQQVEKGRMTVTQMREALAIFNPAYDNAVAEALLQFAELPEVKAAAGRASFEAAELKNGGYVAKNGFLYTFEGAQAAVPEGWRLPSDADWLQLEQALGVSPAEAQKNEAWRGEGLSTLLAQPAPGFNAQKAGAHAYHRSADKFYIHRGRAFYYWTSTRSQLNDSVSVAMIRMSAHFNTKVWRGTSPLTGIYRPVLYSVRCVKDL